jgi:hypothetical protein
VNRTLVSLTTVSLTAASLTTLCLGLSVSLLSAQVSSSSASSSSVQNKSHGKFKVERIKADGSNLLDVLSRTFDRVALSGERNWFSLVPKNSKLKSGLRLLRYRERIAIQPKSSKFQDKRPARFSLTLLNTGEIGGNMPAVEKALRKAAFRDRAGFLHYQRDFRIQDAAQAAKNYRVVPMGAWVYRKAEGGPRIARIFDLFPRGEHAKSANASIFRVVVDLEHQIVLDWLSFSVEGQLISALSYDKLALGTNASFTPEPKWWKPWIDVKSYRGTADASHKLGFTITEPRVLPQGFRLLEVRIAKEPILGTMYSVLIYTDGLSNFFLLQHRNTSVGTPKSQGNLVTVKRFRLGPVTQYDVDYGGMSYLLLGHREKGDGVPTLLQDLLR